MFRKHHGRLLAMLPRADSSGTYTDDRRTGTSGQPCGGHLIGRSAAGTSGTEHLSLLAEHEARPVAIALLRGKRETQGGSLVAGIMKLSRYADLYDEIICFIS